MKAKLLIRNIGIMLLVFAAGLTAYGFISDTAKDSNEKDKVAVNATEEAQGKESTEVPEAKNTEEVPEATETAKATEAPEKSTEAPKTTETTGEAGTNAGEATPDTQVGSAETTATAVPETEATALPSDESGGEQIKSYTLVVTKGMSAMQIANRLEENGIVKDSDEFLQVVVSRGVTNDINVGNYEFTSNHTYDQIISALTGKQK